MKNKTQYVNEKGKFCIHCNAENLEAESFEFIDLNHASVYITCGNCGKKWYDIFSLSGYVKNLSNFNEKDF